MTNNITITTDGHTFVLETFSATELVAVDTKGRKVKYDGRNFIGLSGKPCKKIPGYAKMLVALFTTQSFNMTQEKLLLLSKVSQTVLTTESYQFIKWINLLDEETVKIADSVASILLASTIDYLSHSPLDAIQEIVKAITKSKLSLTSLSKVFSYPHTGEILKTPEFRFSDMLDNLQIVGLFLDIRKMLPVEAYPDNNILKVCRSFVYSWKAYNDYATVDYNDLKEFIVQVLRNRTMEMLGWVLRREYDDRYYNRYHNAANKLFGYYINCKELNQKPLLSNIVKRIYDTDMVILEQQDRKSAAALKEWQSSKMLQFEYDGWKIFAPKTLKEFQEIGETMHNCFGTYAYKDAVQQNGFFGVVVDTKTNKPVLCVEINLFGRIVQYFRNFNEQPTDEREIKFKAALAEHCITIK